MRLFSPVSTPPNGRKEISSSVEFAGSVNQAGSQGWYFALEYYSRCEVCSFRLFCASAISAQAPGDRGLTAALSRDISVSKIDGGTVVLTYGSTAVNRGSSIHRRWFVINDSSCPIALGDAGLTPHYNSPSYQFDAQGTAVAVESVLAFEVLFPVFDLWGDHIRTLSLNQIQDLAPGHPQHLNVSWFATENDVREYVTSVAYVDKVMTANGKIWRADRKLIAQKLAEVQMTVSESGLDTDEAKEPKRP